MPAKRLYVIDGTATLFRAYFGMNKVQSPDGREVGGLLGFGQALSKFVREVGPQYVSLVFDGPEKTFRHDIFPDYKANRPAPADDMEHQFSLSVDVAKALGFNCFHAIGFEADDLMATMAKRAIEANIETVLVTPDKDVHQVIRPGTYVMDPKSFQLIDEDKVKERFGVKPAHLVDFLALAGDSTDNVPGVRGVGPKSATALVASLGSLPEIYEKLDLVADLPIRGAKSIAKKLSEQKEEAFLSLELVKLREDVPLSDEMMNLKTLRYLGPRPDADPLFDELGFHAPLRNLRSLAQLGG
ncbi:MAG: DNA polymerase-1 [Planctomycetota bacterium]|jgi:DNA polymerase-1